MTSTLTKGPLDPDPHMNSIASDWFVATLRAYAQLLPQCLVNSLLLSWRLPRSIPGLKYYPSCTQHCLRHGLLFLFVPHPFFIDLYYRTVSLKEPSVIINFFVHGNFIPFFFTPVFLLIILPLSLSLIHRFHSPLTLSLYLRITDESISRVSDAERVQ